MDLLNAHGLVGDDKGGRIPGDFLKSDLHRRRRIAGDVDGPEVSADALLVPGRKSHKEDLSHQAFRIMEGSMGSSSWNSVPFVELSMSSRDP